MKILSFSLYGNNPMYNIGAIKNAELHQDFYKDWEMRVYYNDSVPSETIKILELYGVKTIYLKENRGFMNSLWRFLPASEKEAEAFISRDLDSRISIRDEVATEEWLQSGKQFHIIRDHPIGHGWVMNAGMWGCRGGTINNISNLIAEYLQKNPLEQEKSIDQRFLRDEIYPIAKNNLFLHDEYFNYERIGVKIKRERTLDDFTFIGEPFNEFDQQLQNYREAIKQRNGY
jgi:protein O-GlcNAc transferase